MISAGCALNHNGIFTGGEGSGQQRAAEPPRQDQKRPLKQTPVLIQPQPDPCEIGEPVAHGHPQKNPKQAVTLRDCPGMGEQMKNAVVHRHVDESKKNPDQDSHILF